MDGWACPNFFGTHKSELLLRKVVAQMFSNAKASVNLEMCEELGMYYVSVNHFVPAR
jgi:hypothetical protein